MRIACLRKPIRSRRLTRTPLLLAGVALAAPLAAQTVPPDSRSTSGSGGPLATQSEVGVRPPKSQSLPAEALPGGRKGPPGLPQAFRWTEDWSKRPASDAPLVEKIRHIPLGPADDTYLSIGGEARFYYTDYHNATLGLRGSDSNDPVQSRLRLLGDLHIGPNLRAFIELGDNREFGEQYPTPPNRGTFDIEQAFVDVTIPLGNAGSITFRPGRFEMPLGNGKLVGVREGVNQRYTYQGGRVTYILPGHLSVDVFATQPVNIKPGSFDDGPDHTRSFHGVYVSAPNSIAGFGTDLYWYEVHRDVAALTQGRGDDRRNNFGARLWKRNRLWDLDLEGNHQSGSFAGRSISAYAVMLETGRTFPEVPLTPRLGLRASVFSGDGNPSDGSAGTFVAAFPRLPVTSEAAFFNLSNLVQLYPLLTLKPRKDVLLQLGPDLLWRQRLDDGVYLGPTGGSLAPYASSRRIGTELNLEASWQVSKRYQVKFFETYFAAVQSFEEHGGRSGNYLGLQSSYRF